jgi:predicted DNA-binding transcriptional regulator YafY
MRVLPAPVTATRLAQELEVSERTIYRDIETLRGVGAIIDGTAGYGYVLTEDAALPPLSFEPDEIEALVLGLREVMQIGDFALVSAASGALAKLQARLQGGQAHRLKHAVLSAKRFAEVPEATVDAGALRQACRDEVEVAFQYVDGKGNRTGRQVKPLGITFMDRSNCLIAYCLLREGFRAFRLDRMQDLAVTGVSFRPHRVPMLRDALEHYAQEAPRMAAKRLNPDARVFVQGKNR